MKKLPRFMLAAPSSGSGKTMLTCGILQSLKDRGLRPSSYKCGPDYIDPMFHTRVLGTPSRNLDPFFTDRETTRYLFAHSAQKAGISVMEGVMGLYDGLGGITKQASSYDLACVTETPVVLVVNAKGMSLSVIPYLKGFLDYQDEGKRVIRGVILNRTTNMTAQLLKEKIETETGLRLIGYVPELEACRVESRHLGLVTPGEISDLQSRITALAEELAHCIDFDALLSLAEEAPDYEDAELTLPAAQLQRMEAAGASAGDAQKVSGPRIAVAQDEAFCFYYQDNLELLELLGAELVPFSLLHDAGLPNGTDGMLLGGGYPELYAKRLSENTAMRSSIRAALQERMPCLAECGGFMYLHERMQDMEGQYYPMVGAISGDAFRTRRLGRFGYITLDSGSGQLLPQGETIRGHEFHYFDSTSPGSDYHAVKPVTGRSWNCIWGTEHSACGYPHLYYWSNPSFAAGFVKEAERFSLRCSSGNKGRSEAAAAPDAEQPGSKMGGNGTAWRKIKQHWKTY